ncbi:hypothetical protein DL764_008774 [Monosporascus ibericus]|uniref:Uncharacterized protein n=1 Tax=Monosporascus ibericus TaxID=155417 RepID=A0A4V1X960_9PEZI|nr:hypothetical protein DL764_008774 [Monosporascus ibericus]
MAANENQSNPPGEDRDKPDMPRRESNYKEGYMVEEDPYVLNTSQAGAAGFNDNVLLHYSFGNNVIEADRNQHRNSDQALVEVDKNGLALALHGLVNPENVNLELRTDGHLIIQGDQPSHVLDALLVISKSVERGSPATTRFYTINDLEQHKKQLEVGLGIARIDGKPVVWEQGVGVMAKEQYIPGLVIAEAWFHEVPILELIAEVFSDMEQTSSGDHTVPPEADRPRKRRALSS